MKAKDFVESFKEVALEAKKNSLKAYLVRYDLGGSSGNQVIVLVKGDQTLYEAMEAKTAFRKSDTYSIIRSKQEVPLSRVKLSELSVTEFFMLQGTEFGS